jgi:vacuolar-type H+-ATPase subunit F/Vma7
MKRISVILLLVALLPVLGGCTRVSNIRIMEDSPGDLETLLAEHEYMRVRQLTGKYPALDSVELQERVRSLEKEYEKSVWNEATTVEADGDLHAAVQVLSNALQKMPHSDRLRDLRNSIEQKRVYRLRVNERETLQARGRYLSDQLRLYEDNSKLEPPDRSRLTKYERNRKDAIELSARLTEHARLALGDADLPAAQACLDVADSLHTSPEATALRSELRGIRKSNAVVTQQKASAKQARIKRKETIKHRELTEILLAQTNEALKAGKLQAARKAFLEIPASRRGDQDVMEIQARLDKAVGARVEQLVTSGDALYRAEKINPALNVWNEALALSPENQEIRERTQRANKVLARLEELKRKQ